MTKKEIKTASGFTCKIDPEIADDMEIIDKFSGLVTGKATAAPIELVREMIGEAQTSALYDHCRNKTGRVSAAKIGQELNEIMNQAAELLKKA